MRNTPTGRRVSLYWRIRAFRSTGLCYATLPGFAVCPSNTGDKLRSGAHSRLARAGTWRHLSSPYGCRHELRQLHRLVGRLVSPVPPSRQQLLPTIAATPRPHSTPIGLARTAPARNLPSRPSPNNRNPAREQDRADMNRAPAILSAVTHTRRAGASLGPSLSLWPCTGACRTPSTARTLPWPPRTSQRCARPRFSARLVCSAPLPQESAQHRG